MNKRSEFRIPFSGLSNGQHEYIYEIGDSFFGGKESLIHHARLKAVVIFQKSNGGVMQLDLKVSGEAEVSCMRCLAPLTIPIELERSLLLRMVEKPNREDDDFDSIQIGLSDSSLDLEPHLYDFISLEVPYNPVHEDKEDGTTACDVESLKYIQSQEKAAADDRWEVLRKLKEN